MITPLTPDKVERDSAGVAHVVALSGGKDSTAVALRLAEVEPRPYTYICTPTGDELPEMFDHWKRLSDVLGKPIWPVMNGTLKSVNQAQGMLPNWRARFCTRILKIEPYQAFMLQILPVVSYVGLRADEDEREGARFNHVDIVRDFPLRRWGWGIKEVIAYNASRGVEIPARTDCARCFFQTIGEWYDLWRFHPDVYRDAEEEEGFYGHTYRSPQRDTWPADLKSLRAEFERGRIPRASRFWNPDRTKQAQCRECRM